MQKRSTLCLLTIAILLMATPPAMASPPVQTDEVYVVQPGDTLWVISVNVYGTGTLWQVIFEANRDILDDPSRLRPGQVLKIPPKP